MRTLTTTQQSDLDATVTSPVFIVEFGHSGGSEYLSCSGEIVYDGKTYTAGGLNIRGIQDSKAATIELPATATRISELSNNSWRSGVCKIIKIPTSPDATRTYVANDGLLILDGIIDSSVFSGEKITVSAKSKYFIGSWVPRYRLDEIANHIPPVGSVSTWEDEKYSYQSHEQWIKTTSNISILAGGDGKVLNPTVSGRPTTSQSNASAAVIKSGYAPTTGEGTYVPLVYGRTNIPGLVFADAELWGSKIVGVAWCLGPIYSIEEVFINDEELPATVTVRHYLGSTLQEPDTFLVALIDGYDDDMIFHLPNGDLPVAYSVFVIPPSSLDAAPRFRATVQGKLVVDPEGDGTGTDPAQADVGFNFVFDQASTTDSSDNAHAITLNGDAYDDATGLHLDGTGDSATIGDDATLEIGSKRMALEIRATATTVSGTKTLIAHTNSATTRSLQIDRDGSALKLYLSSTGTTWDIADGVSAGTIAAATETIIVLEYTGSEFAVYQDGAQIDGYYTFPTTGLDTVTNGNFATDSDWTKGTGWTISSGEAHSDGTQVAASSLTQSQTVLEKCYYKVEVSLTDRTAGAITVEVGGVEVIASTSTEGIHEATVQVASGTTIDVEIIADANFVGSIDDVSFTRVPTIFESGVDWTLGEYNSTQYWDGSIQAARLTIDNYRYGAPHDATNTPYPDSGLYPVDTIYSNKPAHAWYDLVVSDLYGLSGTGIGLSESIAWGDEAMDSGEPRCRIGLSIETPQRVERWLDQLAEYANCIWFPEGSDLKLVPDRPNDYTKPSGKILNTNFDFTEDDGTTIFPDPNWSDRLSLIKADGADASTTITDEVAGNTWTAGGGAEIDTAQSVFGGSSLYIPTTAGSRVDGPTGARIPASGDWTLEFRCRPTNTVSERIVWSQYDGTAASFMIGFYAGKFAFYHAHWGGTWWNSNSVSPVFNDWNNMAIVKEGIYLSMYIGDTRVQYLAMASVGWLQQDPIIGCYATTPGVAWSGYLDGWLDEIRLSDTALYSGATRTSPTAAFQTGVTQYGPLDGWTLGDGFTWDEDTLVSSDASQTADSLLSQTLTLEVGKEYSVSFAVSGMTAGNISLVIDSLTVITDKSTNGTYYGTFTPTSASNDVDLTVDLNFDGDIDFVKVQDIAYDVTKYLASSLRIEGQADGDTPNSVVVKYTRPNEEGGAWKTDTFGIQTAGIEDGLKLIQTTVDLPGVYRIEEASNKAIQKLNRVFSKLRVSWVSVDEAIIFQPGDVVNISNSLRSVDLEVWIESCVMVDYGRYRVTGIVYSDLHFTDKDYTEADEVGKISSVNGYGVEEIGQVCKVYNCDAMGLAFDELVDATGHGMWDLFDPNTDQPNIPTTFDKRASSSLTENLTCTGAGSPWGAGDIDDVTLVAADIDACAGVTLAVSNTNSGPTSAFWLTPTISWGAEFQNVNMGIATRSIWVNTVTPKAWLYRSSLRVLHYNQSHTYVSLGIDASVYFLSVGGEEVVYYVHGGATTTVSFPAGTFTSSDSTYIQMSARMTSLTYQASSYQGYSFASYDAMATFALSVSATTNGVTVSGSSTSAAYKIAQVFGPNDTHTNPIPDDHKLYYQSSNTDSCSYFAGSFGALYNFSVAHVFGGETTDVIMNHSPATPDDVGSSDAFERNFEGYIDPDRTCRPAT